MTNLESLQRQTGGSQFGWHLGYRSSETTPMFELGESLVKVNPYMKFGGSQVINV